MGEKGVFIMYAEPAVEIKWSVTDYLFKADASQAEDTNHSSSNLFSTWAYSEQRSIHNNFQLFVEKLPQMFQTSLIAPI